MGTCSASTSAAAKIPASAGKKWKCKEMPDSMRSPAVAPEGASMEMKDVENRTVEVKATSDGPLKDFHSATCTPLRFSKDRDVRRHPQPVTMATTRRYLRKLDKFLHEVEKCPRQFEGRIEKARSSANWVPMGADFGLDHAASLIPERDA